MRKKATSLMHRFMSDIYAMTTVNHDHLFASLLKALPFNKISEADFRRRVFLLTDLVPDKTLVFCHQSLEIGQVALLTDDRYHKYRDFLSLATETGVVRCEKGVLQINSARFSAEGKFQRIRIDNPLAVAANEVQPLSALKREVRWMAWLPEMLVRRRVADVLSRQGADQFEFDYLRFHLPDESKDRSVGEPFLLRGTSRRLGILLVHGFLAAPSEMRELADYLNGAGFWVYCVRLRGHGTSPEDLATRDGSDWIESVDIGYALMSAICTQVVVGGFSLGGGLALDCAARIAGVAGVFAVSPPFRLQKVSTRFASAVTAWNRFMDAVHLRGEAKDYFEHISERPMINYARVPVAALSELGHFMRDLEPRLAEVLAPTLVVQAQGDPVVDPESTALIFNSIGAERKDFLTFDFSRHGILAGEGSENVHAAIAAFIDKL
jgi:esterase/lipase